ncbi:RusA family crossover junction endodeoxyribonuclease [Oscillospiraceae bacterium N12]|uniref:RusA family crossover junction endodeoxyribonuclease n=1 Tax=Jilunia laotingensis TaxID=2763675 RepID=A0A926IRN0_9BACT|nr:RusA family crossover junction endodeoxyribonuclease [Jilunia laotingensis]MBC8593878.1 RusA family crossover junction endodeoxyribonuclease [Jilunia laotingensis]
MEVEVIHGQIIAKANHYQAVPGKFGQKRIIKDEIIRAYERSFMEQCKVYRNRRISSRFRLFVRVWHSSERFDLDNSLKTLLDCLQMAGAIADDKLCYQIEAEKHLDKYRPRIEFAILEVNEQKQLFNN